MIQGRTGYLTERVVTLAATVEDMLKKTAALSDKRDALEAHSILTGLEPIVNRMENEIESGCIEYLALYQPEAIDLRTVIAILKISGSLERIADHVVNILQRFESFEDAKNFSQLTAMFQRSQAMLHDSIDALVTGNSDKARRVIAADRDMDADLKSLTDEAIKYLRIQTKSGKTAVSALLIGRDLERIADIATNICEDTIYMIRGEIFKRSAQLIEDTSNHYCH
jgi:phosphate transport system protein